MEQSNNDNIEQYRTMAAGITEIFKDVLSDNDAKIVGANSREITENSDIHCNINCSLDVAISHFLKEQFEKMNKYNEAS